MLFRCLPSAAWRPQPTARWRIQPQTGAQGPNRTDDFHFFKVALYLLSYLGEGGGNRSGMVATVWPMPSRPLATASAICRLNSSMAAGSS